MFDLFKNVKIKCIKKILLAVFFASLGWGFPVIASASYTQSIPNWSDVYIFPVSIINYTPLNLEPTGNGQCVDFVKANGFEDFRGNAYQWVKYINTDKPSIGDVVVLSESKYGHLALIVGFDKGIMVAEQNYRGLYIVSTRSIDWGYDKIVGFIRK